jgi:hypothetical protein
LTLIAHCYSSPSGFIGLSYLSMKATFNDNKCILLNINNGVYCLGILYHDTEHPKPKTVKQNLEFDIPNNVNTSYQFT